MIAPGAGKYKQDFATHTDAVKPGHIVTQTGGSQKTCCWPDAAGDHALGVVGCLPRHDVDTAYTAGDTVPVYMRGSGAVVWVRARTSGGALVAGQAVSHGGATVDGLVIPAVDSVAHFADHLGYCTHWHDDIASESWIQVRLG